MPDTIQVIIDGTIRSVPAGVTVAAALVIGGTPYSRRSVSGEMRFALCGMGHCQECRVTIDGRAHQLACQVRCSGGMVIGTGAAGAQ